MARGEVDAAVCGAARRPTQHGLEILADDVADNPGAVTRFVLVAPPGPPPAPTGHDRTTLAATTQNRPGSLLGLLTELAVRGIDLTRIESRPIKDRHAEYWFHLDCTGHIAEPAMGEALAALHRRCDRVRFLGSYPRAAATERRGRRASVRRRSREHGDGRRGVRRRRGLAGRAASGDVGMRLAGAGPARADRPPTSARVLDTPPARARRSTSSGRAGRRARPTGWPTDPVTAVYASRAIRAQQTAAPVAAAHGLGGRGARRRARGVRRRPGGPLRRARRCEEFDEVYAAWWRGELDARLPGGESATGPAGAVPARRRADHRRTATGDVVLVSHGAAIRLAAAALLGDTAETWYVPNTGLVVLRRGAGAAAGRWSTGTPRRPRAPATSRPAARPA